LYPTLGANIDFTRFACYDTTGASTKTFLLVSPTVGESTKEFSPPTTKLNPTQGRRRLPLALSPPVA
jgi:hypothetical protein